MELFDGNTAQYIAIGSAIYALASEIIGLNPKWESSSVVQIVMKVLKVIVGK